MLLSSQGKSDLSPICPLLYVKCIPDFALQKMRPEKLMHVVEDGVK